MKGSDLREILRQENVVIAQLADKLSMSQQNLNAVFTRDDVKSGTLEKIAAALGKPVGFFYGETYGNVSAINGNNNTSVAGNDNTVGSPDNRLLDLLVSKDDQLTMAMKQTTKAQEQMDRVLDKYLGRSEEV